MAVLPPWLQISPEQFTQAAIAGGEQGYRAAAEAGSLAQRGLLGAAQLAQEAASRAAEIRVRREQINAELARNAANVAAARYNAALDFNQAQNALTFAREREANAVAQQGVENQLNRDALEAKMAAPQTYAPSDEIKNLAEIKRLEAAGDMASAKILRDILSKRGTEAAPAMRQRQNLGPAFAPTGSISGTPEQVAAFMSTNAPAIPSIPVGGPTNVLTNPNDPLGLFR